MINTFNAIIDNEQLTSNEKSFLLTLLRYKNQITGECFPSVETIMNKSGIKSKSTFLKVRKHLVEKGLLQYNQKGTKLYYLINIEPVQNLSSSGTEFHMNQYDFRQRTEYKQNLNKNINNNKQDGTIIDYIQSKENPYYDYLNGGWMYSEMSSEFIC